MEITKSQYLMVEGLLAIAAVHKRGIDECEAALMEIVEPDMSVLGGHSGDAIFQPYTAKELLKRAGVTVAK